LPLLAKIQVLFVLQLQSLDIRKEAL
jgi:hypothetical protein